MRIKLKQALQLIVIITVGILLVVSFVVFARQSANRVFAAGPIPPPTGYPKLSQSSKVVTPTLTTPDQPVLTYTIQILNTGAFTASDVTMRDVIPNNTVFNGVVWSSDPPTPVYTDGEIVWEHGEVGFDDSVFITYSVTITPGYQGIITNTALISDPLITPTVEVSADAYITDHPIFTVAKTSTPELPGRFEPLTYELSVTNIGQPAVDTPVTVVDFVPTDTIFLAADPFGTVSPAGDVVTWTRSVNLGIGETTIFTFSVNFADDVESGDVITNATYLVIGPEDINPGEPYAVTVVDPELILSKSVFPDPPGSNSYMTYTLTVLNLGSKATGLVITDTVPDNVAYVSGGDSFDGETVTWELPSLDTHESAQVSFVVHIGDIGNVVIYNDAYGVCSNEGAYCAPGIPTPSLIVAPAFEVTSILDPIAHKPGGGTADVTPTLTIRNPGPGSALDASALLTFGRISINKDNFIPPDLGTLEDGPPCDVSFPCVNFIWTGDLLVGEAVTFTTYTGQSTIGGEEGTHYTATLVVTDSLGGFVTEPITATAIGHITHHANLIPTKTAPSRVLPGQEMTYNIEVFDSGLSTDSPPYLTETVPASVTLLSISDGGVSETIGGNTVISWTLGEMGPGDLFYRSFDVQVHPDLVSGTLIVNDDYRTLWYEGQEPFTNIGVPVTTTVYEVGLIASNKTVTPTWSLPGEGIVLNYALHVVNNGPDLLTGVQVSDIFPWEDTTYQRDAIASSGTLISDIVSFEWTGDIAPFSETLITFSSVVDDFFEGVVTNTATISHPSLNEDLVVTAVAYITDKPVLRISKIATPDPVLLNNPLLYQIHVTNLGQQATLLRVSDVVPGNTQYIPGSASSGGMEVEGAIQWLLPVLNPGESLDLTFQVKPLWGLWVVNDSYSVTCDEGVTAIGDPVVTRVISPFHPLLLPLVIRN